LQRRALIRDYGIVATVILLFVVLSVTAPNFLTVDNFKNVLNQNAYLAITAFGATLVIIAGGFDLSVGAIFALAGVVAAYLTIHIDPAIGIFAAIAVGALVGLVNGLLITLLRAHSFLVTLAMGIVLGGVALAITQGKLLNAYEYEAFTWFGKEELIGDIPNAIFLMVIIGVVLGLVLRRSSFGRYVIAVGGNPGAARLSGIRVNLIVISTFVISGLMAAISGYIEVSRSGTGQTEPGNARDLALEAIAAVVIGGTSILGGRGAIWRTALGVTLLALIANGFNLLGVAPEWRSIASGSVIVLAVGLNALSGRR
jgi:ribose transport system permease protein